MSEQSGLPRRRRASDQRDVAEGFGADAARYDRARPTYPIELIQRIAEAGPDVLDVGCGTGISSRLFAQAGCTVLGLDPDERMAVLARQGGTDAEVATIEGWDPRGRTFDVVAAAQAWHWVDPVLGVKKAAQVLRPGGRFAVFWNAFDPPVELRRAFADVFQRIDPESPFGQFWLRPAVDTYREGCARVAEVLAASGAFNQPEEWLYAWEQPYTTAQWLDLVPTTGGFTRAPESAQRQILNGFGAAVDDAGGSFVMGYSTIAATAVRLG